MGHITTIQFECYQADRAKLDVILRSAPFFHGSEDAYFYYRGKDNLVEEWLEPDCEISITPDGLLINALGDYEVCDLVTSYLQEEIQQAYGKSRYLL